MAHLRAFSAVVPTRSSLRSAVCKRNVTRPTRPLAAVAPPSPATASAVADLEAALHELETSHTSGAPESSIAEQIAKIESMSKALGTDKADPALVEGYWRAYALNGYLKSVTTDNNELTLGQLTGFTLHPLDLKVAYNRSLPPLPLYRGQLEGLPTYAIPSRFKVEDQPALEATSESHMDLEYRPDEGLPQRMWFRQRDVVVTPDFSGGNKEELLPVWLELVGKPSAAAGASLDEATGRIKAPMAQQHEIHVDVLVAIPGWNMFRSANGSCSLFKAVDGPEGGTAAGSNA